MSTWSRLLNWKGSGTQPKFSKSFKRFQKNIALAYIYQLTKFGGLMSCGSKDILKIHPVLCTNTHHDVTDLVNHERVENTKTWISRDRNITFPWNTKNVNLCLKKHILRSYHFVAEVTFNCIAQQKSCTGKIFEISWKCKERLIFLHVQGLIR